MSIVLGRWPLIPDQRCTVSLPQDVFGTTDLSNGDAPNVFCERRLQIELARIASDLLSSNNGKSPIEPAIMDRHMKKLKAELIDKLPPAFRLSDADERWDEQLPHLKRQRQTFRISVFASICMLLRPMIVVPGTGSGALSASDKTLIVKLRISLVDTAMEMLDSVGRLHKLMGGKHNRFFLLSFFTLEPAALLGMYLMTPTLCTKGGRQGSSVLKSFTIGDQDKWKHGWRRMEDAVARLKMLSEVSSIARTGLKVLEKMVSKINETEMARSCRGETTTKPVQPPSKSRLPISPASQTSTHSQPLSSSTKNITTPSPPLPCFVTQSTPTKFSENPLRRPSGMSSPKAKGILLLSIPLERDGRRLTYPTPKLTITHATTVWIGTRPPPMAC